MEEVKHDDGGTIKELIEIIVISLVLTGVFGLLFYTKFQQLFN
jgi:hypothetical protein